MNNALKTSFFTVLFVFLGLFLFVKFAGPLPFSVTTVTTTKDSLFTAQGTGEVAAVPDTAMLSLGVNKDAATVEDAKNQVNQIINQITDDLKKLGIDAKEIKTTNYSVNPNYDYSPGGKQTVRGYSVSADLEVKVKPIEKANQAIDVATKDGATNAGGVQFVLDDSKQKDLENQARSEAIKNAKEKAQSIANSAGIRLGRIVDVQESSNQYPRPYAMAGTMLKTADSQAEPPTQLNPGENKVSITVTISYETY